eukprot:1480604-Lingulodinium_polyedra.AAC.1
MQPSTFHTRADATIRAPRRHFCSRQKAGAIPAGDGFRLFDAPDGGDSGTAAACFQCPFGP